MNSAKKIIILALLLVANSALAIKVYRLDAVKAGGRAQCSAFALYDGIIMTAEHCFVGGYIYAMSGEIIQTYSYASEGDLAIFSHDVATADGIELFKSEDKLHKFILSLKKSQKSVQSWGRNSGNKFGNVIDTNFEERKITISQKHIKGDSGGPVWIGNQLIGLISARNGAGETIVQLYYEGLVDGW